MTETNTVLGQARSADGRTFAVSAPPDELQVGSLVALRSAEGPVYLGQVLSRTPTGDQPAHGAVLGELTDTGLARGRRPFARAEATCLSAELVALVQASGGASLDIGEWQLPGVRSDLKLRPQGFNRHTFLCGQSGSGKTYALGVILEQLVVNTELPMVVLDPNGDYVRLGEPRSDAPSGLADIIRATAIEVRGAVGEHPIRVAFLELPRPAQAAILELDPVRDRSEYAAWMELTPEELRGDMEATLRRLLAGDEEHRAFGQRLSNLGVAGWDLWARKELSEPEQAPRVKVFDLSEFENHAEVLATALSVVERLWADRASRRPSLIVIDEAHNLCPAEPTSPLERVLVDRLVQIAAEGRKYGLWLLLSTQRPSKVHPQVLSQCDNLVLMRMNSPADLAELGLIFGFVPRDMVQVSPFFAQGEFLVAGGFVPVPSLGRVGPRLTVEPGSDVPVPMPPSSLTPSG